MVCSVFYLQKGLPSGGLFVYHQLEDKIVFSAQAICTGESQRGEIIMRKTAKAMALLTAASMIMTAFTPVYAESTDDTAAVDWEKGDNIKAIKEKGVITVATGTYVPFEYRDDDNNIVGFDIDLAQYIADKLGVEHIRILLRYMQRMETTHGKSGYRTAGFLLFYTVIALDKLNDIREAAFHATLHGFR